MDEMKIMITVLLIAIALLGFLAIKIGDWLAKLSARIFKTFFKSAMNLIVLAALAWVAFPTVKSYYNTISNNQVQSNTESVKEILIYTPEEETFEEAQVNVSPSNSNSANKQAFTLKKVKILN